MVSGFSTLAAERERWRSGWCIHAMLRLVNPAQPT